MSLRTFSAITCLVLASCGGPPDTVAAGDPANEMTAGIGTPAGDPGERIACTIAGAAATTCSVERTADAAGTLVTIRHPDGGFRRLRITPDAAIVAADGAVPAETTVRDGIADVTIGDTSYRLPIAAR